MSRAVRWTRQVAGHAPAVLIGFVIVVADRPVLAAVWFAVSRLAYVGFVGSSLAIETRTGALSRRDGPEAAWRRFRTRAAWLMDNDAIAFAAVCLVTAGTLRTPESFALSAALGVALVAAGVGVKVWATSALPEGSYHWRDFFVPPPRSAPSERGPYRFVSNPMYTLGYAHAYGIALVFRSVPGLVGAAFAQATILVLLFAVERPWFARMSERADVADRAAASLGATPPNGTGAAPHGNAFEAKGRDDVGGRVHHGDTATIPRRDVTRSSSRLGADET